MRHASCVCGCLPFMEAPPAFFGNHHLPCLEQPSAFGNATYLFFEKPSFSFGSAPCAFRVCDGAVRPSAADERMRRGSAPKSAPRARVRCVFYSELGARVGVHVPHPAPAPQLAPAAPGRARDTWVAG